MAAKPLALKSSDRTLVIAASVAAHAVVFILLAWRLGATPQLAETPVMNVELMARRPESARPPKIEPTPRRAGVETAKAEPEVRPPLSAVTPDTQAGRIVEPAPSAEANGARQVLRGLLGCEHASLVGLTAAEREHCRDGQMADAERLRGALPTRLNLDRGGFAQDPEPYLARRAKNGCKPRAAGDEIGRGPIHIEGVAAGLQCAWSF